jgi:hypothetical protein
LKTKCIGFQRQVSNLPLQSYLQTEAIWMDGKVNNLLNRGGRNFAAL